MIRNYLLTVCILFAAGYSQNPVSAVFPAKNGSFPADVKSGNLLTVDGASRTTSWLVFNPRDFDAKNLNAAILLLPIKSVRTGGICGVHALMTPVIAPEGAVRERDLHYDDMPIATSKVDSSFADGMLLLNITEQVRSKAFFGVHIRSMGMLSANFCARTAFPSPAVICLRETGNSVARPSARWFTGKDRPDPSFGHPGDFYTQPVRGVLYRKSVASWDSVLTLTPPPPPKPVVAAKKQKPKGKSKPKPVQRTKPLTQQINRPGAAHDSSSRAKDAPLHQ